MQKPDDPGSPRTARPQDVAADVDLEWEEHVAWLDREAADGREPEPWPEAPDETWDPDPWDPEPDDPDLPGPVRPGPRPTGPWLSGLWQPLFAEDGLGDLMPPGPQLAALTEQAVACVARLSDAELVGVLRASRRQMAREQYKQALAAAEFGRRRRAAFEDALARGVPTGCAPGGFPGEELAIELTISRAEAGHLIDDAIDLTARLPRTLAGMAAGLIDAAKAGWITFYTRSLNPADTARADEALAADAADLRVEQVARKAAALEMKLNPSAVKERRERAKRDGQRVEARRESSGNASLSGRELDTGDVLASKAYLDAIAARLRACGLAGPLDRLRALALMDLTQGRDPLDRVGPASEPACPGQPSGTPTSAPPSGPPTEGLPPASPSKDAERGRDPSRATGPAPVPALVNLLVRAETLLGLSTTPAQAGAWGLLDADDARTLAAVAAAHPATRWCVTLTGPDGTAIAHGCARGPRPRLLDDLAPQPPPEQLAQLLQRLNLTFTPIAQRACDHAHAEKDYAPSRKLRHLVRARTATCDAPGCDNPAATTDLDHTVPWPDGPTDQHNPGVTLWTLPSGRTHVTTPTRYAT